MKSFGAFLVLALLHTVTAYGDYEYVTPKIFYISQDQIADIGGEADLECSVSNAEQYPVVWMNVSDLHQNPLSSGTFLMSANSRFSISYNTSSTTYSLHINDVQETDDGSYQCIIFLDTYNGTDTRQVELRVRRPPVISDNSTISKVAVEGSEMNLECYAEGFPPPTISWRREDKILPIYRGNVLKITSVRQEDGGTYYCIAENGIGRGQTRKINVEVELGPVVTTPRSSVDETLRQKADN